MENRIVINYKKTFFFFSLKHLVFQYKKEQEVNIFSVGISSRFLILLVEHRTYNEIYIKFVIPYIFRVFSDFPNDISRFTRTRVTYITNVIYLQFEIRIPCIWWCMQGLTETIYHRVSPQNEWTASYYEPIKTLKWFTATAVAHKTVFFFCNPWNGARTNGRVTGNYVTRRWPPVRVMQVTVIIIYILIY